MSFDEPPPQHPLPAKGGKGSNFVLPVNPPRATGTTSNNSVAESQMSNINLDMLSIGLQIKEPPKLINKSVRINEPVVPVPPPHPPTEEDDEEEGESHSEAAAKAESTSAVEGSTTDKDKSASDSNEVTRELLEDVKKIALEQVNEIILNFLSPKHSLII